MFHGNVAACLAAFFLAACGSSDSSSLRGGSALNEDSGASGSTGGSAGVGTGGGDGGSQAGGMGGAATGGAPSSGGASGDASAGLPDGAPADAASDVGSSDVTAPPADAPFVPTGDPTPDSVACGVNVCAPVGPGITDSVCCVDGLAGSICLPAFPGCANGGRYFQCDDAADCGAGGICCATFELLTGRAICAESCTGGAVQICRTNAECESGVCGEPDEMAFQRCL